MQLNVAEGSTGERGAKMLQWLQTQAQEGVLAVGFCELNGWQETLHGQDVMKNRPLIAFRAANAGFSYSHVMVNSQPYNIGNGYTDGSLSLALSLGIVLPCHLSLSLDAQA